MAQEEALKGVSTAFSQVGCTGKYEPDKCKCMCDRILTATDAQSLTEIIQGLQRLEKEVDNLAPKHETESKLDVCLRQVSAHSQEMAGKASLKDVNVLMDSKADVDEVHIIKLFARGDSNP